MALLVPTAALASPTIDNMVSFSDRSVSVGDTLDAGSAGSPDGNLTYQWQSCDPNGGCSDIAGETSSSYTAKSSDVGWQLLVLVTSTNAASEQTTLDSGRTKSVQPAQPADTAPQISQVAISGSTTVGSTFTATTSYTGTEPVTVSYQWHSCAADGGSCTNVGGGGAQYTLTKPDYGRTFSVTATATNNAGSDSKDSGLTAAVTDPVHFTSDPSISGNAAVGQTLTATATADGTPQPVVSFQWRRCDADGTSNCVTFGPVGDKYTLTSADYGHAMVVVATASNSNDSAGPASSRPTAAVTGIPAQLTHAPTITNPPVVGGTLIASNDATGYPSPAVSYTWYRCDATTTPATCAAVQGPGPTNTYALTTADAGHAIYVEESAANAHGSAGPLPSASTNTVSTAPTLDTPTVTGMAVVGQTLVADATASGVPAPTLTFEWRRCDSGGGRCSAAADATGAQYKLQAPDVGHTLRLTATASNGTQPDDIKSITTAVIKRAGSGNPTPAQSSFDTSVSTAVGPGTQTVTTSGSGQRTPAKAIEFPKVRIRGKLAPGGVRLTYFAVLAPDKWRVEVTCTGSSCPKQKVVMSTKGSSTRLRTYERYLRSGVRIVIRISRPNVIGKYSRFVIPANGAPRRRDLCLPPNSKKAVKCLA